MTEVNQAQAGLWNDTSGRAWSEMQEVLDATLAPFAEMLVERASPGEGGAVLDVGCGAGATTLAMARSAGVCLGVDISEPLIALARKRAAAEASRASFLVADAQTYTFERGRFDAVISRFGVMFFDDPVAAFANIRRAARRDAALAFAAWRGPAENPFMTTALRAAAPILPNLRPPDPSAPGQFAFADRDRVREILASSGWRDIEVSPVDVPFAVPEDALEPFVTKLGPVGAALREADAETRTRTVTALRVALEPYVHDGAARASAACWLVEAIA